MSFDFEAVSVPFRMQPGLRRLAQGAMQLTPMRRGDAALHDKLAVLTHHAGQALLKDAAFDPSPALHALCEQAARDHDEAFSIDAHGDCTAHHLGWSLIAHEPHGDGPSDIGACLRALPAGWRLAALLSLAFVEDFAVIDGATARIPWLAVCLPSHWAPEDKVGRHFAEVHAPVADNQLLITASEHLARLVTGTDRWERHVWTITPRGSLDSHPKRCADIAWPADADANALAAQAWFRTERQTFIPLPQQRLAIFTILVDVQPLAQALALPADAQRVHDALATMSPAVLAYRGLTDARDRLLDWLDKVATRAGDARPSYR